MKTDSTFQRLSSLEWRVVIFLIGRAWKFQWLAVKRKHWILLLSLQYYQHCTSAHVSDNYCFEALLRWLYIDRHEAQIQYCTFPCMRGISLPPCATNHPLSAERSVLGQHNNIRRNSLQLWYVDGPFRIYIGSIQSPSVAIHVSACKIVLPTYVHYDQSISSQPRTIPKQNFSLVLKRNKKKQI